MPKQQNNADENNLNLYNQDSRTIVFEGFTSDPKPFRPNLTPSQVLQCKDFRYLFWKITSGVTEKLQLQRNN